MSTHQVTSTTTTLTMRIGSPRLYRFGRNRICDKVYHDADEGQGTVAPAERQNNSPAMAEPCEVAVYSRRASYEDIISFDALWESALRCAVGVGWKPSVKQYIANLPLETLRMHDALANRTWKNGRPREIIIQYPKKRDGLSIRFPDRVYQRSINDNVLYPEMVKHFVVGNCACQKNKGTDFARMLLKKYLWNFYSHYGNNGYILQIDIKGYYPNMRHDKVKECFGRYIPSDTLKAVTDVLDQQYSGDIGYNPGSQMVQIAGISLLNDIDHFIKERLRRKWYIRYMDDFLVLGKTDKELQNILEEIKMKLSELGFSVSPKKTTIKPLSAGFRFLGFDYYLTRTGKVIMTVDPASVKHERKKLYRLVAKAMKGEISIEKADECYSSWRAHAQHGNSYQLLAKLDEYYNSLKRRANYA